MFKKFRELESIRQTYRWFHEEKHRVAVNKAVGGRFQLVWKLPAQTFVGDVLLNPLYAGAYVYGRRPREVVVKAGQVVKRQGCPRPPEEAQVFIQDHHSSYIKPHRATQLRRAGPRHVPVTAVAIPPATQFGLEHDPG